MQVLDLSSEHPGPKRGNISIRAMVDSQTDHQVDEIGQRVSVKDGSPMQNMVVKPTCKE